MIISNLFFICGNNNKVCQFPFSSQCILDSISNDIQMFTYLNNRRYEITLLFKHTLNYTMTYCKNALWWMFLSMDSTPITTKKVYLFPCFLFKNISAYFFDCDKKKSSLRKHVQNMLEHVRACSISKNDSSSIRYKTKRFSFGSTSFFANSRV